MVIGKNTTYYDTSVDPISTLVPLVIVLSFSIVKEGIEDVARHREDSKVNSRPALVYHHPTKSLIPHSWKEVTVGDILMVRNGEELSSDVVVLACGGSGERVAKRENVCFVETSAIDGETNLKVRLPLSWNLPPSSLDVGLDDEVVELDVGGLEGLDKFMGVLACEPPNKTIHTFNGSFSFVDTHTPQNDGNPSLGDPHPLSEKNLMLRGSVLRSTDWMVGVVVYTGPDTKIAQNARDPPSKLCNVDITVNNLLAMILLLMIVVCIISSVFASAWKTDNNDETYLCQHKNDLRGEYEKGGGCKNGETSDSLIFLTFTTLYNNFVCISMYITLEVVYYIQAMYISNDIKMYSSSTNTNSEARTSNMNSDLGQVEYIFSDKTGTLTKNSMKLRRCAIMGMVYGSPVSFGEEGGDEEQLSNLTIDDIRRSGIKRKSSGRLSRVSDWFLDDFSEEGKLSSTSETGNVVSGNRDFSFHIDDEEDEEESKGRSGSTNSTIWDSQYMWLPLSSLGGVVRDIEKIREEGKENPEESGGEDIHCDGEMSGRNQLQDCACEFPEETFEFLLMMACCNTVLITPGSKKKKNQTAIDQETPSIQSLSESLQAESPDEAALTISASESGSITLTSRTPHTIHLNCGGLGKIPIEILAVNEFESSRKRMSVVVRLPDGRAVLWCKGADSSMFPRSKVDGTMLATKQFVHSFSVEGLRTLVFGKRILSEEELFGVDGDKGWLGRYHEAVSSVSKRKELMRGVADEIESDMTILGCVGIQDELGDKVAETIETLKEAQIKIWMITGDKAETAVSVGKSCSLIGPSAQDISNQSRSMGPRSRKEKEKEKESICEVEKMVGITEVEELRLRLQDILFTMNSMSLIPEQRVVHDSSRGGSEQNRAKSVNYWIQATRRIRDSLYGSRTQSQEENGSHQDGSFDYLNHTNKGEESGEGKTGGMWDSYLMSEGSLKGLEGSNNSSSSSFQPNMGNGRDLERGLLGEEEDDVGGRFTQSSLNADQYLFPPNTQGDGITSSSHRPTFIDSFASSELGTGKAGSNMVLIIDGVTMGTSRHNDDLERMMATVVTCMPVVIACRVSPNQKASLVKMVKRNLVGKGGGRRPITLAIGDGANDVGMIQEAQIGVGISGCEGRHAANSADFALPEFKYLSRLLLVHGRLSYHRTAQVILYSFFKNLALVSLLFYYSFFNGWSGTSLYESMVYGGYNFFLGLPIICVGIFDLDVPPEYSSLFPALSYHSSQHSQLLNFTVMVKWMLLAFFQGVVVYALCVRFNVTDHHPLHENVGQTLPDIENGKTSGLMVFGFMIYSVLIFGMQYKIVSMTTSWTWISLGLWLLSFAGFFIFVISYSYFPSGVPDWYKIPSHSFSHPNYWLALLLVPVVMMFVDRSFSLISSHFWPTANEILRRRFEVWDGIRRKESVFRKEIAGPNDGFMANDREEEVLEQEEEGRISDRSPLLISEKDEDQITNS